MDNELGLLIGTREKLVEELRKELLGPGSEFDIPDKEHELITDLPEVRYSVGILYPQKNIMTADNNELPTVLNKLESVEDDEFDVEEDDNSFNENKKKDSGTGNIAEATDVGSLDEDIGLSMQNMPSSMGCTFFINGDINVIRLNISFGTYRKSRLEDCKLPFEPENPEEYELPYKVSEIVHYSREGSLLSLKSRLTRREVTQIKDHEGMDDDRYLIDCLYRICNQFEKGFVREPHTDTVEVSFETGDYFEKTEIKEKELKLVAVRKKLQTGMQSITVLLVNTQQGSYNGRNSIFQPVIEINTKDNPELKFVEYSNRVYGNVYEEEEQSLELLYRNKKIFATGHGVSVDWNVQVDGKGCIWTEFIPTHDVPQVDFDIKRKKIAKKALSMKYLSDLDSTDKASKLSSMRSIVDAYASWISDIRSDSKMLDSRYKAAAERHIFDCEESCERMYNGLQLLENNEQVYDSFQLANRAMFMQRIHSKLQKEDNYPNSIELQKKMACMNYFEIDDKDRQWRPFQLAFLLMSLRSIVQTDCNERNLVDLIWFPTGGGKTEAYLGLAAITIFYRRFAFPDKSGGTAVIMRYTLRLLAAQQFSRAATLICACESIRIDCGRRRPKYPKYILGQEKITLGLWIGGTHTPNKNDKAKENLGELSKATPSELRYAKDKHHKFQILKCPWCGTKLVKDLDPTGKKLVGKWGYLMKNEKHFRIYCTQEGCEFETALPIQVVDEELYDNPPTLLFGTVDKFAMLPWKNDAGSFFATSNNNRTPELIIQDELHLISGPLGTIVGLYETAIDALCSAKGVRPKVIASTATIRRAKDQCSNLYNREVRQFPSPGIDANDSFFAYEADKNEKHGRLYVGIMPAGKTKAMMEVRTIADLLQRVHMMDLPYEVKDKFWTLAVYFNSLRDLSKCMTLVDDDVKDFMRRMALRFGRRTARTIGSGDELTSRISTSQLNETLEKLEQLVYSKENQDAKKYPINVLLASNMISVGVDIARLNVMLLVGQPKLTSEYIQASSRIGRTYPGVAFTLYDGAKSRDRSHYEQFKAYHQSFYRYVEPTGVTPFSKPARDRGLHALMVALMRHMYGLSKDTEAALFEKDSDSLRSIEEFILNRIKEISNRSNFQFSDESQEVLNEMNEFWREWHERAEDAERKNFYYGDKFIVSSPPADSKRLLKVFGQDSTDTAKETLTSMRNVDQNVIAGLIIWE